MVMFLWVILSRSQHNEKHVFFGGIIDNQREKHKELLCVFTTVRGAGFVLKALTVGSLRSPYLASVMFLRIVRTAFG